jgi:shikimate kinase
LLGWTFEDLDERIELREGRARWHEIFRDSGEPAFRLAEHAALKELLK